MAYRFNKSDWYELLFTDLEDKVIFYEKYWWCDCYVSTTRQPEVIKTLRLGTRFLEKRGSGILWV